MTDAFSINAKSGTIVLALAGAAWATTGAAEHNVVVKHIQTPTSAIAAAVWVGDTLYVSGQTASPVTPADAAKGTTAVYGDTKTQSMSVFAKIEARLKEEGLTMADVVMMHVFLVGDPAMANRLDFAGMEWDSSRQEEAVDGWSLSDQDNPIHRGLRNFRGQTQLSGSVLVLRVR